MRFQLLDGGVYRLQFLYQRHDSIHLPETAYPERDATGVILEKSILVVEEQLTIPTKLLHPEGRWEWEAVTDPVWVHRHYADQNNRVLARKAAVTKLLHQLHIARADRRIVWRAFFGAKRYATWRGVEHTGDITGTLVVPTIADINIALANSEL